MNEGSFYIDTVCETIKNFDSGHSVFNEYLQYIADSAVVHYILDSANDNLIAYFSLVSSAILHGDPEKLNAIPAIELKMFALDKHYHGANLSSVLLDAVIKTIQNCASGKDREKGIQNGCRRIGCLSIASIRKTTATSWPIS